ncbi:zinc finger MYM-type protein 1-like [Hydra vulgaris]|uniref:Zinc finger MYM-type protein 1-like n=1 Tax=Hydra vulgaris TaxID=6087 RepID=A0ABM4D0P0_HYDVU
MQSFHYSFIENFSTFNFIEKIVFAGSFIQKYIIIYIYGALKVLKFHDGREKKLSGAQYRKRRAANEGSITKQTGSLLKYLSSPQKNENGTDELKSQVEADREAYKMTVSEEFEGHNAIHVANKESEGHKIVKFSGLYANYSDLATWVVFDDEMRQLLIEHEPKQVNLFDFPKDSMEKKFSKNHYNRRLVNGDKVRRHWLQYSVSNNSVYCFCCKLFTSSTTAASSLSSNGSHDWKSMSAILSGHEKSSEHLANFQSWKEFKLRLRNNKTFDAEHLRLVKKEEQYWQQILKRLIAIVRVLGMQNLAFRGTHEKLNTTDNGNFLKFVEFLALFDPLMDEHLRKIKDNETHVPYLGKDIQNELIHLLSNAIKQKILTSARDPNNSIYKGTFLGFQKPQKPLKETTGAVMAETIIKQLGKMSLSIENLRGQGYDNGRNMRGKNKGVQRRILDLNPRALFVPCCAHTLNVAVNDGVECCLKATAFFGLV